MLDTVLNQSGAVLLLLETSPTLHHCTKPNKFENTKKIIITNKKERNLRRRKCIHLLDHEESTLQKEIEGSPEKKGCKFRHFNGGGEKRSEMKLHEVSVMKYLQNSSSLSELKRLLDSIVDMFMARIF